MADVGFGASSSATLKARFSERGDLTLGRFRVSALVPLGLASGPPLRERPGPAARGAPAGERAAPGHGARDPAPAGGVALASKTGESMDLRGVRPYRKGDRIRDLSARTWARTGKPAVREYQEEYFTRVGVVLDCVAPPKRSARSEEAFEAAVSLTAGVVAHLGRGDALVDLLVTGGEIHALTLGRSLGFLEQALDHLAVAELEANVDRGRLLERLGALPRAPVGRGDDRRRLGRGPGGVRPGRGEERRARAHHRRRRPPRARAPVKVVSVASILAGKGLVL